MLKKGDTMHTHANDEVNGISNKYLNMLFKHQKVIEFTVILAISFSIGFRFTEKTQSGFGVSIPL